jgi:hypothetical protein
VTLGQVGIIFGYEVSRLARSNSDWYPLLDICGQLLPGEAPRIKGRTRRIEPDQWPIVLLDHHPGYISWEQFRNNKRQLDDNRTWRPEERRGAVREGSALLQGVVLCGRCGRRMSVRYLTDGQIPSRACNASI